MRLPTVLIESIEESVLVRRVRRNRFVSVNCKLLQPVVAIPMEGRATITIPAGTLVEIRPILCKGGVTTEVLWEGECFSAQLDDVISACAIYDIGKVAWYRNEER